MTGEKEGGYHCETHGLEFEDRTWCPQCEIEFEMEENQHE